MTIAAAEFPQPLQKRLARMSFCGVRRSSGGGNDNAWKKEKKRRLALSLEDRRKEYEKSFIPLSEISTWRTELAYQTKLSTAKHVVADAEKEAVLDGFQPKEEMDLNDKVSFFVGDITKLEIDAIVNAANNSLLGGGGVDGAIHRGAGKNLYNENLTLGGCPDGEARISGGYKLPAKYVISTVGPRGHGRKILENAYLNCLNLMRENNLRSIAFPCISTGIYGYPNDDACAVALRTARRFLEKHHQNVDRIIFCLFLQVDVDLYMKYLPIFFPGAEEKSPTKVNVDKDKALAMDEASGGGDTIKNEAIGEADTTKEEATGEADTTKEKDPEKKEATGGDDTIKEATGEADTTKEKDLEKKDATGGSDATTEKAQAE